MKNYSYLICLAIFIAFSQTIHAQISLGLKSGYTNAWEDYQDDMLPEDAEIDIHSFNVYFITVYEINPFLDLNAEIGFIQRGAACVPGWQPIFEGDTKFYLSYIDLPIFIQGNLPLFNNRVELFGKLGYGLSYMVYAQNAMTEFGSDEPAERKKMDFSIFNRLDHGVHAAGGIAYNLARHQIFLESAYYRGMRDAEINNVSKNNNINFNLGYRFKL